MDSKGNYIELPESSFEVPLIPNGEGVLNPSDLTIYPNPTNGIMNLNMEGLNNILHYQVYSIDGKALYSSGNISNIAAQTDLSHLNDGMYIIRVQTLKGVITKKLQLTK